MNHQIFQTEQAYIAASVETIVSICKKNESPCIALAGGNTPKPVYTAFAARTDVPFDRVAFFEGDERYVPRTNPASNRRLIEETLLSPLDKKPKSLYFFDTSLPIPEALRVYESTLQSHIPLDMTILGLGPDGHTASLFPHSPALQEKTRLVAHTETEVFTVRDRLTLTFPAIMASGALLLLAGGPEKKATLQTLLAEEKSVEAFPAKKLLEHPNIIIFSYK